MKAIINIAFVFLLAVGFSSCKKNELPPEVEGTPVVWIEGKVNGVPFKYVAGENATYSTAISHNIDSQSRQYIFKIVSPDLEKSLEISINNSKYYLGDWFDDLSNTIVPGNYKYTYSNGFPFFPYRTSEIIFLYIDHRTKTKYYTIPYNQNNLSNAEFRIVTVKDVEHEGKPYKMAEISFRCRVKDPNTGFWYEITDGHGHIPFGEAR